MWKWFLVSYGIAAGLSVLVVCLRRNSQRRPPGPRTLVSVFSCSALVFLGLSLAKLKLATSFAMSPFIAAALALCALGVESDLFAFLDADGRSTPAIGLRCLCFAALATWAWVTLTVCRRQKAVPTVAVVLSWTFVGGSFIAAGAVFLALSRI